mgnify:FL=1|jgi:hypothetical protein
MTNVINMNKANAIASKARDVALQVSNLSDESALTLLSSIKNIHSDAFMNRVNDQLELIA